MVFEFIWTKTAHLPILPPPYCRPLFFLSPFKQDQKPMSDPEILQLKIDPSMKSLRPIRRRRRLYAALALCLAALLLLFFKRQTIFAVPVEVVTATRLYPSQTLSLLYASGYVVPQRKAAVASKVTGRLVELLVEEGTRVKKGDVVARLEDDDVLAQKAQAEANVNNAAFQLDSARAARKEADILFERDRRLVEKGAVSMIQFRLSEANLNRAAAAVKAAEAGLEASRAALKNALVALEYTRILAPFDAVVLTKDADVGDIVTPIGSAVNAKAAVVTIADMDSLEVEADVSETNLARVKIGQPCEIMVDAIPDVRFRAAVHMIVPTADRSKASVMIKVRFLDKDPRILPQMSAKVNFLTRELGPQDQTPVTVVSKTAIVNKKDRSVVYFIRGERVSEAVVETGKAWDDLVEIRKGLGSGDKVAVAKDGRLKDRTVIKVIEKE
ncbi:Efflux pump, RND family, membrane fusion protein [uncultured Desulfobacterium sp.]|uniref:Efflux pump, RND family, membrane fusion protein n=1 Tax=uncultured Desulfobacterium sp. TaxID=201089 RepID=A0A445MWY8_9BACT|nr:Efflux pump, RND family, membrane fusion protein [uncultured Desulfobacterium sp.]